MKDVNGDDTIDINDRTFIGRHKSQIIYGMTNNFTWKNPRPGDHHCRSGGQ